MGTRDADGIFLVDEKWADTGDTGNPNAVAPLVGWPLVYSQEGGSTPSRLLFNLLFQKLFTLGIDVNQYGCFMPYAATIDYPIGAYVQGSDFIAYKCLIANGPASAVVGPVGDATGTWLIQSISKELPLNWISGLGTSNGTDADHDINFASGECRNTGNTENITASSAFVKQIDATWAAGTAAGGLASGVALSNDTWYHLFITGKADDGGFDFGFDTSLTAANLLADAAVIAAGLTTYRRIGSVLTDGSANILGYSQFGDEFLWDSPPLDINATTLGTTAVSYALSTPLDVQTIAIQNLSIDDPASATVYMSSLDQDDESASFANGRLSAHREGTDSGVGDIRTRTNTSSQVRGRSSVASTELAAATVGYIDIRGKE